MTLTQAKEVGEYLRKQREAKGLKPKDLACKGLSEKTIQRIEKGVQVSPESYRLYVQQLGLSSLEVAQLFGYSDLVQRIEEIDFDLEFRLDLEQSLKEIGELQSTLDPDHPYQPILRFMKCKGFFYLGQMEKAEQEASWIIEHLDEKSGYQNIIAFAHNVRGVCCFHYRSLPEGVDETEKSLSLYDPNAEYFDQDRYYMAMVNKASYLEKMGRFPEDVLSRLIDDIHLIERSVLKANVLEIVAKAKRKAGQYDEALKYIHWGLRITMKNPELADKAFEFWVGKGNVYEDSGQIKEAKRAYLQALKLKDRVLVVESTKEEIERRKAVVGTAYSHLGNLHRLQADYQTAREYFDKALELANEDSRFIDAYKGLGELFLDMGERRSAIKPLEKALELAQKRGVLEKEKEIAGLLADCYEDIDEEKHIHYLKHYRKVGRNLQRGNQY